MPILKPEPAYATEFPRFVSYDFSPRRKAQAASSRS